MTEGLTLAYAGPNGGFAKGINRAARKIARCTARDDQTDPPPYLTDEIALYEWRSVAKQLLSENRLNSARRVLLAGYCSALAKAIRAEETLIREGRYYETHTTGGSLMRRRHPAAQDAEQAWADVRRFGRQLGLSVAKGPGDDADDGGGQRRAILK